MLCVGSHGNNMDVMVNLASFIAGKHSSLDLGQHSCH